MRGRQSSVGRSTSPIARTGVGSTEFPDSANQTPWLSSTSRCSASGTPIGVLRRRRDEARPFTAQQIALLETFADQAVIAIENARLFEELEQRNASFREQPQVTEALEQQTATAEVLRVIASSPTDLQRGPRRHRRERRALCDADDIALIRRWSTARSQAWSASTASGPTSSIAAIERRLPIAAASPSGTGDPRAATRSTSTIMAEQPTRVPGQRATLRSATVCAPALACRCCATASAIGVLDRHRARAAARSPTRQIALLETFADQAVIAIENARLFEELQEANSQLAEASQHKSQFLANMSHELRTPLNAIIGYSEMLQEEAEDLDADAFLPDLQRINAAGKHLLGLINDILDLSKIEAGRMDLFVETFEVGQLVRRRRGDRPAAGREERQHAGRRLPRRPRRRCRPTRPRSGRRCSTCSRTPPSSPTTARSA